MPHLNTLAAWAQIIAIPIAIIAILISLWSYRRTRRRKALSCGFYPIRSPIEIKAGSALEGDVEIQYRGQSIQNLFLVRARLRNTGNMPIVSSDVVEPVTFTFDPGVEILREPQVLDKRPENLELDWHFPEIGQASRPRAVSLDFDLLNQGDEFVAEVTCTGNSTLPKVTARIQGITEIGLFDALETYFRSELTKMVRILVVPCLLVFVLLLIASILGWDEVLKGLLAILSAILSGAVIMLAILAALGISPLLQLLGLRRR
jgi:hypothetical protein